MNNFAQISGNYFTIFTNSKLVKINVNLIGYTINIQLMLKSTNEEAELIEAQAILSCS